MPVLVIQERVRERANTTISTRPMTFIKDDQIEDIWEKGR